MKNDDTQSTSSVNDFLAGINDPKRRADSLALAKIMQDVTGVEPALWGGGIVGFGTYHYVYETGREGDTVAVGFAPRKAALVLYGMPYYEQDENVLQALGPHTAGKSCLYIKDLSKIHEDVLAAMIAKAFQLRNTRSE